MIHCFNRELIHMKHDNKKFKAGDKVIWLKRIPGGDYVFPVAATIVAVTAKRIKIEADDDGQIVVRYVQPESLRHRS